MERFERVTKLARELKISVFFEVDELVDKLKNISTYEEFESLLSK